MGSIFSIPATLAGSCIGTSTTYCLCKINDVSASNQVSKFMYLTLIFFVTMCSYVLQQFDEPLLINLHWKNFNWKQQICDNTCIGDEIVYRMSMAMTFFFITMALFTSTVSKISTSAHQRWWLLKLIYVSGLCIGSLYIPPELLPIYVNSCKYLSPIFILLQIIILIDFGYSFNDKLIDYKAEKIIIIIAVLFYIASGGLMIYLFTYFYENPLNTIFIFMNFIMCCTHTVLSLSYIAPHGTLLTSSIVSMYMTFLCFSALHNSSQHYFIDNYLAMGFTIGSLCYSAYSTSATNIFRVEEVQNADTLALLDSVVIKNDNNENEDNKHNDKYVVNGIYHLTLSLTTLYIPMVLTNWGGDPNNTWVKIITSWICGIIYIWSLIAPKICPSRDFSV